ncbi:MAG TPA: hypothetical protein PKD90_06010 [Phnomibacter sp.]|nr:hypothetical protein [Phnomibacter sp.]
MAPAYEDEGDLYLFELYTKQGWLIWDTENNLKRMLPCPYFEQYEKDFFECTGRKVLPLAPKCRPVKVSSQRKWSLMKQGALPFTDGVFACSFEALVDQLGGVI